MRQILEVAEMSSGGAYNYFASKDDIDLGLVAQERTDIDYLVDQLQKEEIPSKAIAQLVHDTIAYTDADEAAIAVEIWAESLRNPAVRKMAQANSKHLKDAVYDTVSKGLKDGTISKKYSSDEITEWLLALIEGYVGRVATNSKLKHKSAACMAKKTVMQLFGDK
ncbi:MAG: TetR/AcrR family transcriptional repressor of uid operon [Granulosicoccus sp.]|jgi:TetR/AcrR family transcriptional repressor of uid operon